MTFILSLLFFIVVYFIIKTISVAMRVRKTYRQFRDGIFGEEANRQAESASERKKRSRPAKKIADDVGEYVEFEEISAAQKTEYTHTDGSSTTKTIVEEQITDVEWEDVR